MSNFWLYVEFGDKRLCRPLPLEISNRVVQVHRLGRQGASVQGSLLEPGPKCSFWVGPGRDGDQRKATLRKYLRDRVGLGLTACVSLLFLSCYSEDIVIDYDGRLERRLDEIGEPSGSQQEGKVFELVLDI